MSRENNRKIEVRRQPEQERSKDTVQVILEAAKELFGQSGVDVVSMTALASRAGLSKAVLYRYFNNKQAIVRTLAENEFADNRALIEATLAEGYETPREYLIAGITKYCQKHLDEPFRIKLRAAIHADPQLSDLDLMDSKENVVLLKDIIVSLYPELANVDLDARLLLFSELIEALVRVVAKVDKAEATKLISEYVDLFLGGIEM